MVYAVNPGECQEIIPSLNINPSIFLIALSIYFLIQTTMTLPVVYTRDEAAITLYLRACFLVELVWIILLGILLDQTTCGDSTTYKMLLAYFIIFILSFVWACVRPVLMYCCG